MTYGWIVFTYFCVMFIGVWFMLNIGGTDDE